MVLPVDTIPAGQTPKVKPDDITNRVIATHAAIAALILFVGYKLIK